MKELVDEVLAERRIRDGRRRRLTTGAIALAAHSLLAAAVALAPVFAARKNPVRDYMRVMIVPAKALGDATAPARPARQTQPVPAPVERKDEAKPVPSRPDPRAEPKVARADPAPGAGAAESSGEEPVQGSTQRKGAPDGTTFGTSPFGSSEASFDDPNFMYGYYVQQMLALIGSNWARPRASPGTEMIIHYNISRQGELTGIEIVQESGNRAFDLAGFRAVALASPLPPLPQSYRSDSLGVNLVIR